MKCYNGKACIGCIDFVCRMGEYLPLVGIHQIRCNVYSISSGQYISSLQLAHDKYQPAPKVDENTDIIVSFY